MKNTNIIQDLLDSQSFQDWASNSYDANHKFCQTDLYKQADSASLSTARLLNSSIRFNTNSLDLSSRTSILKNIHSTIRSEESNQTIDTSAKRSTFSYAKWMAVAASIAVLFMFLVSSPFGTNINLQTDYAEVLTETLPDGSVVSLDANSSLTSVGEWSGSNDRILKLTNDAFFSVTNSPKVGGSAFKVLTDHAEIEVLGTEFYVEHYGSSLRVIVKEGKVRVSPSSSSNFEAHFLEAGDELIIRDGKFIESSVVSLTDIDKNLAWTKGKIIFDQTSWIELQDIVKDRYGYTLDIHPALASSNRTITGSFPNNSVEMLMETIAETFELQIGYKDATITIDYSKKD